MNFFASKLLAARLWRAILALLLIVVSYLALTTSPQQGMDLGWDKLNHTAAFVALGFSAWLGFPAPRYSKHVVLLSLLAYGGAIEILQLWVPGRSCEWADLAADVVGITVGACLAALAKR